MRKWIIDPVCEYFSYSRFFFLSWLDLYIYVYMCFCYACELLFSHMARCRPDPETGSLTVHEVVPVREELEHFANLPNGELFYVWSCHLVCMGNHKTPLWLTPLSVFFCNFSLWHPLMSRGFSIQLLALCRCAWSRQSASSLFQSWPAGL